MSSPSGPGSEQPPDPWQSPPADQGNAAPPPPPPGAAPPYGQAPYGQAPYGQAPYGQAGYGYQQPPASSFANWGQRIGAALVDYVAPFLIGGIIYASGATGIGVVIYLLALVWALYNAYQGGATGQSFGKKAMGIRLLGEASGAPIGGGLGVGRYFLHIIDGLPCYLGYLWPIWDSKRQTFADKILRSVVVKVQ